MKMICRQCGTENNEGAKFCKGCGSKLEAPQVTVQQEPARIVQERNFCPECGTLNAVGAKFCKSCGRKLAGAGMGAAGEAAGNAARKAQGMAQSFRRSGVVSNILPMLKMTFTAPADAIKKAHEDPDCWLSTVVVMVVKALLFALLPTLWLRGMMQKQFGGELWNYYKAHAGEFKQELGFSFGSMGLILFIITILTDVALIFCCFGVGKAFGGRSVLKNWIGTVCPASVIGACGGVLVLICLKIMLPGLVDALENGGGKGVIGFIVLIIAITAIWQILLIWKAFETEMALPENKTVYAFVLAMAASLVVSMLITNLIGGIVLSDLKESLLRLTY